MDYSNQQKQAYLRQQIIEAGLSAEDFVDFLTDGHRQSKDVSEWTMNELAHKVEQYKKLHLAQPPSEQLTSKFDVITDQVMYHIAEQDQRRVEYDSCNLFDTAFSTRAQTIPFLLYEKCSVERPAITVTKYQQEISRPELKSSGGSFFGIGKYSELWFTIRSNMLEGDVVRSDSDFEWLRKTFTRLHPGLIVPPYERSPNLGDPNEETRNNKAELASMFLNSLGSIEVLSNSKIFQAFVTWQDYSRFSEFKTIISKQPSVNLVRNVPSLMSTVPIQLTSKNRSINRAVKRYSNEVLNTFDELQTNLSSTINDTVRLAGSVVKVADSFADIQELYSNMCNYAPQIRNTSLNGILIEVNNSLIKWASSISHEAHAVKSHLSTYMDFWKKEHESILELMRRRQLAEDEYLKYRINSVAKRKDKPKVDSPEPKRGSAAMSQAPIQKFAELELKDLITFADQCTSKEAELKYWSAYLGSSCQLEFTSLYERRFTSLTAVFRHLYSELAAIQQSKQICFTSILEPAHRSQALKLRHQQ